MALQFPFGNASCYDPLDPAKQDIRVLTVQAGDSGDPVRCSLEIVSLLEEPQFESVSYCWGDATVRGWIILNGHVANVPISAKAAIQRMRLPEKERVLWIDAICINQAGVNERGAQVALTGQIYGRAYANLIHLGGDRQLDTSHFVELLRDTVTETDRARANLSEQAQATLIHDRIPVAWRSAKLISNDVLTVLQPLYAMQWWQRLWVVQEAALAAKNTCVWGNSSLQLHDALKLAWLQQNTSTDPLPQQYWGHPSTNGLYCASIMHEIVMREHKSSFSLSQFIFLARTFLTTEPRDRIFALLELFSLRAGSDGISALLTPDYRKAIADVYRDATRYILENEPEEEEIFGFVCHRSDTEMTAAGESSWTFKFDRKFDPEQDSTLFASTSKAGEPPGITDTPAQSLLIAASRDLSVLAIEAFVIGNVTWVSDIMTERTLWDYGSVRMIAETMLSASQRSLIQLELPNENIYSMAASILTAGSLHVGRDDSFEEPTQKTAAFQAFLQHIRYSPTLPPPVQLLPRNSEPQEVSRSVFYQRFRTKAHNRSFCLLASGNLGMGPKIMKPGDVAVVCRGATYPLILRPTGDKYSLVGAVYLHGLTAGEVFGLDLLLETIHIN